MTNHNSPKVYLTYWEAVNFLAFGVADEGAGTAWRAAEIETRRLADGGNKISTSASVEIENEELLRFSTADKELRRSLKDRRVNALGTPPHLSKHEPIDQTEWLSLVIDPIGGRDNEGRAEPRDIVAGDRREREWDRLRFPATEILALRGSPPDALGKAGNPPDLPADPYRTGLPGKPSIGHLIIGEFERRAEAGETASTFREEATALRQWAAEKHKKAPTPTQRTVENHIRARFRKLGAA